MELTKLHPNIVAGIIQDNPIVLTVNDDLFDFDGHARTILMIASAFGAVKCVEFLLQGGANVRIASPTDGSTALHLACAAGPKRKSAEIVALLIKAGGDAMALDREGRRPTDLLSASMISEKSSDKVSQAQEFVVPTPEELKLYASDSFRMFSFKIENCPKLACPHDWETCPYLHPGEKARRRDPRLHNYHAVPCPDFRKGHCRRGDICPFAHGVFEAWLHPTRYRTQLCREGCDCSRPVCFFAHSLKELREPDFPSSKKATLDCCVTDGHCHSPESTLNMLSSYSRGTTPGCISPVERTLSEAASVECESSESIGLAAVAAAATTKAFQQQQQQAILSVISNLERLAGEKGIKISLGSDNNNTSENSVSLISAGNDMGELIALNSILAGLEI